jgi:hypothetical protein
MRIDSGCREGGDFVIMRRYIFVGLMACCLTALLFAAIPTIGQTGEYDPWLDINDDGYIGIDDIFTVASHFGAEGQNMTKAGLLYDSGWINITDMAGQYITVTHGLNVTDWNDESIDVGIIGKTSPDGELLRYLGLTDAPGWNKTYGGTNDDEAWDLVETSDGGYAIAGYTYSYGAGARDFWLVKTDAAGNHLWNKTYGGTYSDWAWDLVETSDGGYAIAGYTASYGAGMGDFWLVKTDADGNMQWNQTYGGTSNDYAFALVETSDGGYAIAGYTYSFGAGIDDFWLVKTDANGNALWNKTYGGTYEDWAWDLVETSDGGYAIAGYTYSYGAGARDFWLVKTDAAGNHLWNKTYGGTYSDWAWDLVETSDGGYAIAGYTASYGAGSFDFWLVKTDAGGNHLWNQTYGGTGDDDASSVVQTVDGGYALAGYTDSYGAGARDFWLVKTDAAGNHLWNQTYGGTNADWAMALAETSDEGFALAGITMSYGEGGKDFWLVKIDTESGLIWVGSGSDTVTLFRGETDACWNFVRVRIWAVKENP